MNRQILADLVTAVLALRVFGGDVRSLLRRAAAMGVRVGVSELRRIRREGRR